MSFLRHLYYEFKPYLPTGARLAFRRLLARRALARSRDHWPILPKAAKIPEGWPGWPEGRKFAFVLTHDVEGESGMLNCRNMANLEQEAGFRSSFNFVPEGTYQTPPELRDELVTRGFEVGVHDLRHDGKLYRSSKGFKKAASRINHYLKAWNAVGFRSGFMHHNLEWLHELEVQYDMSTFDTDPFEPQPDPRATIFPFWVKDTFSDRKYVELPYTLAQDSTLFLLLGETSARIWIQKLDWVAENGGMVLVNTHPDYMSFKGQSRPYTYPSSCYLELLEYIQKRYAGQYWAALPREVNQFMRTRAANLKPELSMTRKVWIDLDNTPHVPFFKPIIAALEKRGFPVVVTSRKAFQVCELASATGLKHTTIGRHYGKNSVAKVFGLFFRSLQFVPFVLREKPSLAVSHGARSQILICNLLRIPTILLADYEHAAILPFLRPTWLLVPAVIPTEPLAKLARRGVIQYPGIKEDVYVPGFRPSENTRKQLQLTQNGHIVVTVRPPANEAHYRSPMSDKLFETTMDELCAREDVQMILLPRNAHQLEQIKAANPDWFRNGHVIVPSRAVDGLELIWESDLVISGGGTMNREAAALGVPVYSIFRGKTGAVDAFLQREGRLMLLESPEDVKSRIELKRRSREGFDNARGGAALPFICDQIERGIRYSADPEARQNGTPGQAGK